MVCSWQITRAGFIEGLLSVGAGVALGGCAGLSLGRRPVAVLGVLANTEVGWLRETKTLEKAFRFYRRSGADAVVIAGGVTRNGYPEQFKVLDQVWAKVFGGTTVRLITQEGEHEVNGFRFAVSARHPSAKCEVPTFYGEGKNALTDEIGFYPRKRRAVYAGSLSGVVLQPGFEQSPQYIKGKPTGSTELSRLAVKSAQGLLVTVTDSDCVMRRLDFAYSAPVQTDFSRRARVVNDPDYVEDVAEPWVLDAPLEPQDPAFPATATVQLVQGYAGNERIVTLRWPPVHGGATGARALYYEVTCAFADSPGTPFLRHSVLSDGFHLAPARDAAAVRSVFRLDEIPNRHEDQRRTVVFSVTPISSLGMRGKPIRSQPLEV